VLDKILEAAAAHPAYETPGPNRGQLEELLV
jgi:hypothetical protein